MAAARAKHNIKPFNSYILGGFECSTHRRRDGCRLDLVEATKHDIKSIEDYRSLLGYQIYTARDGIRWHLVQAQSDHYVWSSFLPMLRSAREVGIQVIWDLAHYGYPDWLDIWDKNFVHHYEKWARAVACLVKEETDEIPSYVPINEISYWSWAGGTEGYMNPFATDRTPQLREILVRAAIAGIEALWSVDPRACIIHAEPVTHMVPASESLADYHKSQFFNEEQFRAWDMISGLEAPLLGGHPRYLGILGVNFYPHNEATTERAVIDRNDNRYKPFCNYPGGWAARLARGGAFGTCPGLARHALG